MNVKKFSDAMSELDNKYIDEALHYQKKTGRKKKKHDLTKWGTMAACLCLIAAGALTLPRFIGQWNQNKQAIDLVVDAKVDSYESLDEIENAVSVIAKVKKISEDQPMVRKNSQGEMLFTGTIGNVEVIEIYKDTSGKAIKVFDSLLILENETYSKTENINYHIAGYKKMEENKEYMLFLNYSEDDGWYVPCSAIWGKYLLDLNEDILFQEENTSLDNIWGEVIDKYSAR